MGWPDGTETWPCGCPRLLSDFDRQMKVRAIREELGAAYPLYQEYKAVAGMERIQARIPYMIVE